MTRLQRRVAEGVVDPNNVAVYFCRHSADKAELDSLKLDMFGEIENWPDNFFGDEMEDIKQRTLSAMQRKISERDQSAQS